MIVLNGKRRYLRERVHLPLMVWWEDQGRRSLPSWTLNASPAGFLLELPEITNLAPEKNINLTLQLGQRNQFDIGPAIIVRSEVREGKQLLGVKLENENEFLFCPSMLSVNPRVLEVKSLLNQIRSSKVNILIRGETGTGKNVLAKTIHKISKGDDLPFIRVNCPGIPDSLFEAELFGHERGAFTDAKMAAPGYFRLAGEGTVLLDEISEIHPHLQAKLLRVIEDKEFMPVGGQKLIPVKSNIIATTNLDLEKAVQKGQFRQDLFFRLCEMPIHLPPLRERKEDVSILANYFLYFYCSEYNREFSALTDDQIHSLNNHDWPGNVRELENYMKQTVLLGRFMGPGQAPEVSRQANVTHVQDSADALEDLLQGEENLTEFTRKLTLKIERDLIKKALKSCQNNKTHAAKRLGISYRTLLRKMDPDLGTYHIHS